MNYRAADWVFALKRDSTTKMVLMVLADHADPEGKSWPSMNRIAAMSGTSTRTVQRILKDSRADGLLTIEPRYDKHGRQTSNCYYLALDRAPDNLSPLTGGRVTECQGEGDTGDTPRGDTGDTPRTTKRSKRKRSRDWPVDNSSSHHWEEPLEQEARSWPENARQDGSGHETDGVWDEASGRAAFLQIRKQLAKG